MDQLKKLKQDVEQLKDVVDGKNLELELLNSELTDTLSPSIMLSEMSSIFLSMLMENQQFVQKNGMTSKAKESRDRLLRLLEISKDLDGISTSNYNLKATNRLIHAEYQKLRVAYRDLKAEKDKMQKSLDF